MVLFALLHFASYSLALLDTLGNCQQMSTNFKLISWAWLMSPLLHLHWNSHFCHLQWDTFLFRIFPHFCFQNEMDFAGQNSWWGARMLISLVEFQSRNILRYCLQKLRQQSNCVRKSVKLYSKGFLICCSPKQKQTYLKISRHKSLNLKHWDNSCSWWKQVKPCCLTSPVSRVFVIFNLKMPPSTVAQWEIWKNRR